MTFQTRTVIGAVLAPLMMLAATPVLAAERTDHDPSVVEQRNTDRGTDVAIDTTAADPLRVVEPGVSDRTDVRRPDRVTDRVADRVSDRVVDRITDHRRCDRRDVRVEACCPDRPVDRIPERCLDDERPHDVNVRQLIWRLIKAQQWEKLWQLLHRLGVI